GEVVLGRHLADYGGWWHTCFTLSGFARAEFEALGRTYLEGISVPLDQPEGLWDYLHDRTGGSLHLMRLLIRGAYDRWATEPGQRGRGLRLRDLPDQVVASQIPWNYYQRYLIWLITRRDENWDRLEALING